MLGEKVFLSVNRRSGGGDNERVALRLQTEAGVTIMELTLENYALLLTGQSHVEALVVTERKKGEC